jgi:hypothetical protein
MLALLGRLTHLVIFRFCQHRAKFGVRCGLVHVCARHPALAQHLHAVTGLMRAPGTWDQSIG